MHSPRIVVFASAEMHSRRAMLEGLHSVALARGWIVFRSLAAGNLEGFFRECDPAAVVICPEAVRDIPTVFRSRILLSLYEDRTGDGVPSLLQDDMAIGRAAAEHLLATGLRRFASFSYTMEAWACQRMNGFRDAVLAAGAQYDSGGEFTGDRLHLRYSSREAVLQWLTTVARPCGIFACCDAWARGLALDCARSGLCIPEEIAVLGADNDPLQCELFSPPISSVATPWHEMGRQAAVLLDGALKDGALVVQKTTIAPTGVVARRSTDLAAVDDTEVAEAVAWIRRHGHLRLGVTDVLRAVPVYRRRLERRFRAVLGRSILEEIRRSHIEIAKRLLTHTDLGMTEVAVRSGYANATLLGVAFRREVKMTPSQYRRRAQSPFTRRAG